MRYFVSFCFVLFLFFCFCSCSYFFDCLICFIFFSCLYFCIRIENESEEGGVEAPNSLMSRYERSSK